MTEASVSFAGNLTDQPELRHTEAGIARAMFGVAVSARKGKWYEVKYDAKGAKGWVHRNALGM